MSLTRSIAIVELVCSTGSAPAVGKPLVRGAGLAVHEVLADQRLRADLAMGVLAQVRQAGLGHLGGHHRDRAPVLLRDLELAGLAGPDARDLEVAALGEPERVVEEQL